ncbi:hypothetical protein [Micromonospora cathayae]|uniref:Uncharacterized protein n=1 Tax=Micromonospora cathayae TaxID=3028804 RepID=A0ABY7ZJ87_9ACTN|nr:hypothetical protein [Micromonospora sp. HUAS 3]WDZ82846.1 hypothetical protein PVK37_20495 [Micromonospora sp. HUAS 3]
MTEQVPAPLPDRIGHIGGVESLTLDGVRYYFGFDFSSDLVLSPLIDDPAVMAAFASRHMRQRTGTHDEAYWADLVAWAETESSLVPTEEDRRFTTESIRANRLTPGNHLRYLLAAATSWDGSLTSSPEAGSAYRRPGLTEDEAHLECAAAAVPGNWSLLFDPLRAT